MTENVFPLTRKHKVPELEIQNVSDSNINIHYLRAKLQRVNPILRGHPMKRVRKREKLRRRTKTKSTGKRDAQCEKEETLLHQASTEKAMCSWRTTRKKKNWQPKHHTWKLPVSKPVAFERLPWPSLGRGAGQTTLQNRETTVWFFWQNGCETAKPHAQKIKNTTEKEKTETRPPPSAQERGAEAQASSRAWKANKKYQNHRTRMRAFRFGAGMVVWWSCATV